MAKDPLRIYTELQKGFSKDVKADRNHELLGELFQASAGFLGKLDQVELKSMVPGKQYFAFTLKRKLSRAVNASLFGDYLNKWAKLDKAITSKKFTGWDSDGITRLLYSAALAFCCYIDLTKDGDQKTPGTFFEYLVGHLFARTLGINPETSLPVLNLDMDTNLPTDFVFNLGKNRPKFHLPVKTSTRERVIQVWAHQRVLDGVYGTGRFLGTPVILTETKSDKRKREVIEICLPDQWRIYQMHIAQLKRVYYLDVPVVYNNLNQVFPPISVKPFGDFFFEADALGA